MSHDEGILICELGAEQYALPARDVRHVERAEHMRPDVAADGRAGVLMLGDRAVPVFRLAASLGRPVDPSHRAEGHIAVTGDHHSLVGWLVDRIARPDQAEQIDIAPLPKLVGGSAGTWFEGIVRINDDRSALLLAPHCLNPLSPAPPRSAVSPAVAPAAALHQSAEPVAVVFTTSVLPKIPAHRYAITGRQITAVVQPAAPIPVPGSADHVVGVTWWRRAIVPVIDFRAHADRSDTLHRRRLIAQCGGEHHGTLVAFSIQEVLMCRPDPAHRRLQDVPCPPFVSGVFDVNGVSVALIDLERLLEAATALPSPASLASPAESLDLRDGDAIFADFLVQRAPGNPEALSGPLDPPAFGL